jgi:hypothetical protein
MLIAPYALFRLPYDASPHRRLVDRFHETAQGIEIPCSGEKIPCSAHPREFACNLLKLRTNSWFSRMLREFGCNDLKILRKLARKSALGAESAKIPC